MDSIAKHLAISRDLAALTILDTIPLAGNPQLSLGPTHTITRCSSGRFYLSDELNHRVIILDSHGGYHGVIGVPGSGPGEFMYPRGLAIVESAGNELLAVCDAWNHRIQFLTLDGIFVSSFGSIGNGRDHFNEPSVALPYGEHCLAVLDRGNHRIKICSLSGETIAIHGAYTPSSFRRFRDDLTLILSSRESYKRFYECGYNYPQGMAITGDGAFVVADTGNRRISIFEPKSEHWKIIELDGEGSPSSFPQSVAALPDGNIVAQVQADSTLWLIEGSAPHRIERLPCPELDPTKNRPAILSESLDTLLLVDGQRKVLMRCRISDSFSQETAMPPADMTINQGRLWLEYFRKAARTDTIASALVGFISVLKNCYLDHASGLARKESEYAEIAGKQYALLNQAESVTTGAGIANKQVDSKSKQMAPLDQVEKELANEEEMHVQSVALPVLLFRSLPEQFVRASPGAAEESFRLMMQEKLKCGMEEFHATLHRLKKCLLRGSDLDFARSAKDCIRLVQLHRNARNLCAVLNALPSRTIGAPRSYEAPDLPTSLHEFKDKSAGLVENICLILVLLCIEWRFDKSAKGLIERRSNVPDARRAALFLLKEACERRIAGANDQAVRILGIIGAASLARLSEEERRNYFIEKGHALLSLERADDATSCYREAHPERPDAPLCLCLQLALAYERCGRLDAAAKLYPRALKKAKAESRIDEYELAATGIIRIYYMSGAFEKAAELIRTLPPELACKAYFTNVKASSLQHSPESDANTLPELLALLARHPDYAGLSLNLAVRHALNGDMPEALKMIEREKKTSSWVVPIHFVKGVCLRIDGQYAEALHEFTDNEGVVEFSAVPMELFLAAYCLRDSSTMEQAMTALLCNMQKDRCFSGFLNVPGRQKTLVEEAMAYLNMHIERRGETLSLVWLNCSTLRYGRREAETVPCLSSSTGP
jgi:tetratricopeptide (TPR) repeat protein